MCDTIVAVADGVVRVAKNADRDPNESQFLEWRPARRHGRGMTVQATWVGLPQVRSTLAVLLSRPCWGWGAEMGANEAGVVVANEAVFTTETVPELGLTGMDLVRLALERATSATGAVDVIVDLIARHGQGGRCGLEHPDFRYFSSFVAADASGAFLLETTRSATHVTPLGPGVHTVSNALVPSAFADRWAEPRMDRHTQASARRACTAAAAGVDDSVAGLMAALRAHGPGGGPPRYDERVGGMAAPCLHAGGTSSASQTTASWVSELRVDGDRHWATATAAPCLSLFKPVAIGRPVSTGARPSSRADGSSLWWRHEVLHRATLPDPGRLVAVFAGERDALEAAWRRDPPDPVAAFGLGDRFLADWTTRVRAVATPDHRPSWLQDYWAVRNSAAAITP